MNYKPLKVERLEYLVERQTKLKPTYEEYLRLYKIHIQPLAKDVREFWMNTNEIRKLEHQLQYEAYMKQKGKIEKLSYVDPSKRQPPEGASAAVKAFKKLTPAQQAQLLQKLGGNK
jgi:hypothetical protein